MKIVSPFLLVVLLSSCSLFRKEIQLNQDAQAVRLGKADISECIFIRKVEAIGILSTTSQSAMNKFKNRISKIGGNFGEYTHVSHHNAWSLAGRAYKCSSSFLQSL